MSKRRKKPGLAEFLMPPEYTCPDCRGRLSFMDHGYYALWYMGFGGFDVNNMCTECGREGQTDLEEVDDMDAFLVIRDTVFDMKNGTEEQVRAEIEDMSWTLATHFCCNPESAKDSDVQKRTAEILLDARDLSEQELSTLALMLTSCHWVVSRVKDHPMYGRLNMPSEATEIYDVL